MQASEEKRTRITPLALAQLADAVWRTPMTVRFRHCDPAGIVFTPRYFEILNEAIEAFFIERLKIDYYGLIHERKLGLGYAAASCEFLQPNRMGDALDVAVLVQRVGQSSYTLVLPVMKKGAEMARGRLVTVTTSLETHKACPIPADIRTALLSYKKACGPMPDVFGEDGE